MAIVKTLWQTWLGPKRRPAGLMDGWKRAYEAAGWQYRLIDDEFARQHLNPKLRRAFNEMPEINGKADIIRWSVLHEFGGFLVDADAECVDVIPDSFLQYKNFACYENEICRPGLIAAGYFGAEKGSRFVAKCIEDAAEYRFNGEPAWLTVGPGLITNIYPLMRDDLHVFSARTFIPCHYSQTLAPGEEKIYAHQYWGSTHNSYDKLALK